MSSYAALNPFIVTSVGENDLWNAGSLLDVPYIHSGPFDALKAAVDQVRVQKRSQVRFVRGAGGSGKSHVFARLHRVCADSIFYAYAPNPPLQPEALEQFILSRVVSSLRHPARAAEGKQTSYSQLRLLAYALLKPVVEQDVTFLELHEAWAEISLDTRKEMIHQAVQLLEADHPMVPRSVLRCLLNVLREDKEHLAAQWLSGAAYLTENELKYLGVPEPLQRGETGLVIQLLGKLAAQAGTPVVLVLDQLDLITTPPQFDEMQRLLFSLIDQSQNWAVLIGLVAERFAMWDTALTQALRGRIGVPDSNAPLGFRLPVIDMLPVASEQKRLLLYCRLETSELVTQRKKDGITSAIHPLAEEDIAHLTSGGAIFPRHLFAAAAEVYATRASGAAPQAEAPAVAAPASVVVSKMPLAEKIDALLREAMEAAKADIAASSAVDLGERVRDLIELMAAPAVTITEGDLRKTYGNFDGADRWFEWGGGKVRVVTSDAMRSSFIAVLERLKEADCDTLLLRHAVAPVSGQLTLELLNVFKEKNSFRHVPASEAVVLAALGRMLAAQREGSYEQLAAEPAATKDNVLAALRNHTSLRGLGLWDMIQKTHAPKASRIPTSTAPSVLAAIARQVKPPPAIPAASVPPPPVLVANPATPPVPVAKPVSPPMPMAQPQPPPVPGARMPQKPVGRPPSPPVAKPPSGVSRLPMTKQLPPS